MCCGKPDLKAPDLPWYVNVIAGPKMVTFGSETEALKFLNQGIDNVPENMQQIYAALQFRYENAHD